MIHLEQLLNKKASDSSDVQLTEEEINMYLEVIPEWEINDEGYLVTEFELEDFSAAVELFKSIAAIAENEGHHPNIYLYDYKYISVMLQTHSSKSITEKDFVIAAKIDQIVNE